MTNRNLFKVMDIVKKYVFDGGFNFHCEHDVLFINVRTSEFSKEDLDTLHNLGCVDDDCGLKAYVSC